jgi:hypothetical protein
MASLVYREQLDGMGCDHEDCDCQDGPMFLHAACHPEAATHTYYHEGVAVVVCAECEKPVIAMVVASEKVEAMVATALAMGALGDEEDGA